MAMIGDGRRRGYRLLLDEFWDAAQEKGISLPCDEPVSAAAFCKARRKLKPEAVRSLLHRVHDDFEESNGSRHRFKSRRILAVDGMSISTQRSEDLTEEFGVPSGAHCPQALVTTLFDVMSKMPIDATVSDYKGSERDELVALLPNVRPGDVLVLDRGYTGRVLLHTLCTAGIDFVIRVPAHGSFKAVQDFIESAKALDSDITIQTRTNSPKTKRVPPLNVRVVRREGPDGPQAFVTSLPRAEFTRDDILKLYRARWEVELFFRVEKSDYIGHGQFRAKTADGVRQEVFAFLLFTALTRRLMSAASETHGVPYEEVSQKGAILATASYLTNLLIRGTARDVEDLLERLLKRIAARREPKRPGRSFPRVSWKPQPRWDSTGRRGTPKSKKLRGR